jgi:alpha-L-fucosidase 2
MQEAARFLFDFMIREPEHGWLVVCPSLSPENCPAITGRKAGVVAGVTMDNQLVFDLFHRVIRATDLLYPAAKRKPVSPQQAFADSLRERLLLLAPMQIGRWGQLQEWMHDWDDPSDTHRHVSHLYGLFPSNQISPFRTPALCEAARTSLIHRGDASTGWSMAWKINLWARLLDGNHAYRLLTDQLSLMTSSQVREVLIPICLMRPAFSDRWQFRMYSRYCRDVAAKSGRIYIFVAGTARCLARRIGFLFKGAGRF